MNYAAKVGSTLFGREYLCVVLDEAHFCRNPGPTHWGPLAIMEQAKTRLVMTATPVQTRVEVRRHGVLVPRRDLMVRI
jgi:hypothetical protein